MDKVSIKNTPYNNENPFMKAVVIEMGNSTQIMAAGDRSGQMINKNDAIIWKNKEIKDKRKFIKLYHNGLKDFFGLNRCEMDLIRYIMRRIRKDQDKVAFTYKMLKEESDFSGDSTITRTLLNLMNKGIIARAETDGVYYINPNIFFNGDRVAFVKSYVMKNNTELQRKHDSTEKRISKDRETRERSSGERVDTEDYQIGNTSFV
ncbi:hypothetical protein CMI37_36980 [Candidatus Pacearchaeota archaeon]|nr:hypothetical protein [Candidatus Pacearchaeota archaeon]